MNIDELIFSGDGSGRILVWTLPAAFVLYPTLTLITHIRSLVAEFWRHAGPIAQFGTFASCNHAYAVGTDYAFSIYDVDLKSNGVEAGIFGYGHSAQVQRYSLFIH